MIFLFEGFSNEKKQLKTRIVNFTLKLGVVIYENRCYTKIKA